ncbi:MAG TPA: crossover junction endodeoxyribonuclease RuvC, partial [Chitinophagaceae bacterium]|nr:crossover junction endodeoxyribonuclease RuvC [Chitinophagaceae bacterium]
KEQVMKMLQSLLQFRDSPKYFDATDALAVAVCHYFQGHAITSATSPAKKSARKSDSWTAFVARNPSRVRKPS